MYNLPVLEKPVARMDRLAHRGTPAPLSRIGKRRIRPLSGALNCFQTDRTGTLEASSWSLLPTIHQKGAAADLQSSPTEDAAK